MSKMGISTVSSYCGAQVFEAVGLDSRLVERYFPGTAQPDRRHRAGRRSHAEVAARHALAYPANPAERRRTGRLEVGGEYQWRREGELHLFNPETVFLLQHATRSRQYDVFRQYTATVDALAARGRLAARAVHPAHRRPPGGADRRGRAGHRDRQAVRHRRHVATARSRRRRTRRSPSR